VLGEVIGVGMQHTCFLQAQVCALRLECQRDQQDAAKAKQHDEKLQKGSREVACADSHDSEPADLSLATQTTLISIQMVCVSCSSTTCRPSRRTST